MTDVTRFPSEEDRDERKLIKQLLMEISLYSKFLVTSGLNLCFVSHEVLYLHTMRASGYYHYVVIHSTDTVLKHFFFCISKCIKILFKFVVTMQQGLATLYPAGRSLT